MEGVLANSLRPFTRVANGVLECEQSPCCRVVVDDLSTRTQDVVSRPRTFSRGASAWVLWDVIAHKIRQCSKHIDVATVETHLRTPVSITIDDDVEMPTTLEARLRSENENLRNNWRHQTNTLSDWKEEFVTSRLSKRTKVIP